MQADMIYYNGIIFPVIPDDITYEAIAIRNKEIQFVGKLKEAKKLIGKQTQVFDLNGKVLLPGFIDTHAHLLDTGLYETQINFQNMKSINEVLDILVKKVNEQEKGTWIKGGNLDENLLIEKRLPTREELDSISPSHPIYINHRSYHCALINSYAVRLLNISSRMLGFEHDANNRYVSGLLTLEANTYVKNKLAQIISEDELLNAYQSVSSLAAEVGLTTIHCIEGGEYWSDQYPDFLLKPKEKTFDPVVYFNTSNIEKIKQRRLTRMGGDIFVDGSIGNRSAALIEDYSDSLGDKGVLLLNNEDLKELISKAHKEKIQISFHAIGDRAIEELLSAFEQVIPFMPAYDHRHRIEHFGVPLPEHIIRAKKLGLAIATQPAFTYQKHEAYLSRLGHERFLRAYPLKSLISQGVLVGGGSDSMVSPLNPLFGIHAAVNAPNKAQRITVEDAIKMYTIWAAALAFEENVKGSLEVGKYADMVILDENIFSIKKESIKDINILKTIYHGEVVYKRNE